MKILAICTDWSVNKYREENNLYGGIGYYRLYKPYEELQRQHPELDITIVNHELVDMEAKFGIGFLEQYIPQFDIIITKAIDNGGAASMVAFLCEHFKKKLVLDLDDNYFAVTPDQPAYKHYHPGSEKRAIFSAYLSLADALIVSTEPLKQSYAKILDAVYNKKTPIYVMPNYNDVNDWNYKVAKKKEDRITIGWAGSTTHDADLELVMPAINKLMQEYPNLYLELTGGITNDTSPKILQYFNGVFDRVAITGGTEAWKGYAEMLSKKKWDIGIAPLVNNEFTRGKSHIKWMEYSMFKIPCVASRVYPYFQPIKGGDTIIGGQTGVLAIDGLDFYRKLKVLIENKDIREKIGNQAYEYVKNNLQWKDNIENLYNIIQNI